jgi:hypothetical protein
MSSTTGICGAVPVWIVAVTHSCFIVVGKVTQTGHLSPVVDQGTGQALFFAHWTDHAVSLVILA